MKTGRKGEDPTKKKNGVEPTKAQSEVKVTAKRPEEPPRKKYYTEEDYKRNEEIKASNKAKREKYESDMASYNKAMNLYTSGGTPTASEKELSMLGGSTVRGKKSTFASNKDIMSASKSNEDYESSIKSGKYVDINDPRIDAKTRYFLKGATMKMGSGKDILGERTGNIAVPYEKALGKEKPTKWADVYGGQDFDPYEFEKASRSGDLDKYMNKKGIKPGEMSMSEIGAKTKYKTPTKPVEEAYEKEQDIKETDFLSKLPIKKPGLLPTTKGTIPTKKEKGDWQEPTGGVRTKTRVVKAKNQSLGDYIGGNIKYAASKLTGDTPVLRGGVKKTREALFQGKTGREAKLAKAYFGAGYENKPLATLEESKAELKGKKKELRADIKSTRRGEHEFDIEMKKAELKDVKAGLKQNRLASKYLKASDAVYTGVREGQQASKYGSVDTYTGEAMKGYRESKQNTYDPEANKKALREERMSKNPLFKSQSDNPANRNTTFGRKIKNS